MRTLCPALCKTFLRIFLKTCYPDFAAQNVFYQHIAEKVPDPRKYRKDIPEGLVKIIFKCMAKKRDERYQSAQDVLNDIKLLKK